MPAQAPDLRTVTQHHKKTQKTPSDCQGHPRVWRAEQPGSGGEDLLIHIWVREATSGHLICLRLGLLGRKMGRGHYTAPGAQQALSRVSPGHAILADS